MKHRRELSASLYLDDSSVALFDRIQSTGQEKHLLALFIDNLNTVLAMHKGETYVTQHEFMIMQQQLLDTMKTVMIANPALASGLSAAKVTADLAATPTYMPQQDIKIEFGPITVTETSLGSSNDDDDDDLNFTIT